MQPNPSKFYPDYPILIEPAKVEDAEPIAKVTSQTWLDTYPNNEAGITREDVRLRVQGEHGEETARSIKRWREHIKAIDDRDAVLVARSPDKVVGFVAAKVEENGRRRIVAIYVLPKAQRKGAGGKLLEKALDWCGDKHDIYLDVVSYNQKAISFYEK